ncbi:T9SS type A sorting domain-containing protein [bacterium]|nr:T9SS type A sorting domain-containing protein [bacterium]
MKKTLLCIFSLLIIGSVSAQTNLSGNVTGSLGPGNYHVIGDITLPNGGNLTISPGTNFEFDEDTAFLIHGLLTSSGAEGDSILFVKHSTAADWDGLYFYGDSDDESMMEYCRISYAEPDTGRGGGVAVYSSNPTFNHCVFSENSTIEWGGGLFCASSNISLSYCEFANNNAGFGGGLYCRENSIVTIDHCLFVDNYATQRGGGIRVHTSSIANLTNCTIAGNSCGFRDSSGMQVYYANAVLTNCIVWGNYDGKGYQVTWSVVSGTIEWNYSCVESNVAVTENGSFTEDPLFVGLSDYHVVRGSRAVDAGDPASGYSLEPEPNGDRINIGYYGGTSDATISRVYKPQPFDNYVMRGIPVGVPDGDPTTLFADDFNYSTPGLVNWRVSRWDIANGKYVRYQEPDNPEVGGDQDPPPFSPGLGFWVVQDIVHSCSLDVVETQMEGAVIQKFKYGVALEPPQNGNPGCNMMANPYPYEYDWRETMFTFGGSDTLSIVNAAIAGWISGYAYQWDEVLFQYVPVNFQGSTPPFSLPVWEGFIIEQLIETEGLDVVFKPRRLQSGQIGFESINSGGWSLQLPVVTAAGDYRDEHNIAGIASTASDEYDYLDATEQVPNMESYAQLFFPHYEWGMTADLFTYDYRDENFTEPKIWEFTVGAYELPGRDFVLSWPNIDEIDTDYHFQMEDVTNEVIIDDMREADEYIFTVGTGSVEVAYFRLTVGYLETSVDERGTNVPENHELLSTHPNPFNAQTQITLNLPSAADISLKVFDILGREAAELASGQFTQGAHEIIWDASDQASGIYLLSLRYGNQIISQKVILMK